MHVIRFMHCNIFCLFLSLRQGHWEWISLGLQVTGAWFQDR
jgi:hypothetical protein